MGAPDDGLRALITKHLREWRGSVPHWVPIESSLTASGIPDLLGTCRGRTTWVECKATSGWKPVITEFQVGFLLREVRAGGYALVLTRRRSPRRLAADELWVHRGEDAPRLRAGGLRAAPPLLVCGEGPIAWQWDRVGAALFG